MPGLDYLQSVQYVTAKEKRFAVLEIEAWESLIEWLETIEDIQVAQQALAELEAAGNSRQQAGWLKWDDVKAEL